MNGLTQHAEYDPNAQYRGVEYADLEVRSVCGTRIFYTFPAPEGGWDGFKVLSTLHRMDHAWIQEADMWLGDRCIGRTNY